MSNFKEDLEKIKMLLARLENQHNYTLAQLEHAAYYEMCSRAEKPPSLEDRVASLETAFRVILDQSEEK